MAILTADGIILNFGTGSGRNVAFAEDRVVTEQHNGNLAKYMFSQPLSGNRILYPMQSGASSQTHRAPYLYNYQSKSGIWRGSIEVAASGNMAAEAGSEYYGESSECRHAFLAGRQVYSKDMQLRAIDTEYEIRDVGTPVPDGRVFYPPIVKTSIRARVVNEDLTSTFAVVGSVSTTGFSKVMYHPPTNALYGTGVGKTQMLKIGIGKRNDLANYPDTVSLVAGLSGRNGALCIDRTKSDQPIYFAPVIGGRFIKCTFVNGVASFTEFGPTINVDYDVMYCTNTGFIYCLRGRRDVNTRAELYPLLEINTATGSVRALNNVYKVVGVGQKVTGEFAAVKGGESTSTSLDATGQFIVTNSGVSDESTDIAHVMYYGFNVANS